MSELNRCRDKLDFWQYVAAILAMAIMLLSAMLVFCKTVRAGNYLSVGVGNTQFEQNALGSGTWHQAPEYGTAFLPDSPARNLIVGHQIKPWFGVEAGLWDFGRSEILGRWTTDDNYQTGRIGVSPSDAGFTSVRLRGYSAGLRLSTPSVHGISLFGRVHLIRSQWDFDGYFIGGQDTNGTTLGAWHCNVRGTDVLKSIGIKYGNISIEQAVRGIRHARTEDVCTSNFSSVKTVFISYEWRF